MESKIIFGEMIDYLRKKNGLSMEEFGNIFDKNKSTISRWIKGTRFPKIEEAEEIANYFNVPFEVLIFGAGKLSKLNSIYQKLNPPRQEKVYNFAQKQLDEQENQVQESSVVYIQSKLSAGTGIVDLDPEYVDEIHYDGYIPKHDLAFEVSGDSMTPFFEDGEIVFVEKTPDIRSGQIIAVEINDEAYIKKAYLEEDRLRLVSLNKKYEDIYADGEDDIRIVGRVIL